MENQEYYQKQQNQQLENLANAFTLLAYNPNSEDKQLLKIKKLMTQENPDKSWKVQKAKNLSILTNYFENKNLHERVSEKLKENSEKVQ